jgi:hypothetical protein
VAVLAVLVEQFVLLLLLTFQQLVAVAVVGAHLAVQDVVVVTAAVTVFQVQEEVLMLQVETLLHPTSLHLIHRVVQAANV